MFSLYQTYSITWYCTLILVKRPTRQTNEIKRFGVAIQDVDDEAFEVMITPSDENNDEGKKNASHEIQQRTLSTTVQVQVLIILNSTNMLN